MTTRRTLPPPLTAEQLSLVPPFDPVPVRVRRDGWTPARQHLFLEALAECGCVAEACRFVGMSARTAYRLRSRPDAPSFAAAWDAVMATATDRMAAAALSRAIDGEATPIFYKGAQVGERRRFDNRLAMFILSRRRPETYGPAAEGRDFSRDAS